MLLTSAVAVTIPMPGMPSRRVTTGSAAATAANSRSKAFRGCSRSRSSSRTAATAYRRRAGQAAAAAARLRAASIITRRAPRGIGNPSSRNIPPTALSRAVRVRGHCTPTRCRACTACCAGVFTATGWMASQRAASRSAAASARSVLFRRTYGWTSWAGSNRTTWPRAWHRRPQ